MAGATHVALIRGINVGGRNPVPMARLREELSSRGAPSRTYIQSGNVILDAPHLDVSAVTALVEEVLAQEFDVTTVVVVLTAPMLRSIVEAAPDGFPVDPSEFHRDEAFLRAGVDGATALGAFRLREGVDEAWAGDGAVYFRRVSAERTKSRMNSIMKTPFYAQMTFRHWATTSALVQMLDA
ncbi:MAG: DUF1697 domain-containing protein [Demequina sp.]|uniref:DUF1697 domain-containing protein n=1 Tax=Demequina sp. TaxID=2050685 RepID=UPI003A8A236A